MIFGLKEETGEDIGGQISNVMLQLNLKPKAEACRVGSSAKSTLQDSADRRPRPVKVTVGCSAIVKEVLSRAKRFKVCPNYRYVYIAPDRSLEQQAEHKKLVVEIKKRLVEQPEKRHFIRGNAVISEDTINFHTL